MNYPQESNPYTARHPVIYPQSALRVLMLFCAIFFSLPPTSRRRSGQDSFFFTFSSFRPTTRFYVSHQEKNFSSPDLFLFLGGCFFALCFQNLDNIKMPEYDVTAIRFGLSLNFEVYIRATAGGGP